MRYNFPAIIPAAINRGIQKLLDVYYRLRSPLLCMTWGIKAGRRPLFWGPVMIRTHGGEITLGDCCRFNSSLRINPAGLSGPTVLETLKGGRIDIGDFSGFSSVIMSSMSRIRIGRRVMVGGNVRIFDNDFHALESNLRGSAKEISHIRTKPIFIGNEVFIGTNAIILKGSYIGDRSIVAAGSVVFGLNVPPDSLVKGNPATVVSKSKGVCDA